MLNLGNTSLSLGPLSSHFTHGRAEGKRGPAPGNQLKNGTIKIQIQATRSQRLPSLLIPEHQLLLHKYLPEWTCTPGQPNPPTPVILLFSFSASSSFVGSKLKGALNLDFSLQLGPIESHAFTVFKPILDFVELDTCTKNYLKKKKKKAKLCAKVALSSWVHESYLRACHRLRKPVWGRNQQVFGS